jgi:hypothetical protein
LSVFVFVVDVAAAAAAAAAAVTKESHFTIYIRYFCNEVLCDTV